MTGAIQSVELVKPLCVRHPWWGLDKTDPADITRVAPDVKEPGHRGGGEPGCL